jgi:hypothetical protein
MLLCVYDGELYLPEVAVAAVGTAEQWNAGAAVLLLSTAAAIRHSRACRMLLQSQEAFVLTSYDEYWRSVRSCWFAEAHQGLDQQQHSHGQASATRAAGPADHFRRANNVGGPSLLAVLASSTPARDVFWQ